MTSASPSSDVQRVPAGKASDYIGDARKLVKCGTRNIAVVRYKSRFYAIDNACYHHGGPLFTGDIEDMGGHPCIVCPWHSYRIALDSGEGLYMGIEIPPGGGRPVPSVKSKGCKQRVHTVVTEGDDVFVLVDLRGPAWESDAYATMALANREGATAAPVHGGGGGRSGLHSGVRSGHVLRHDANVTLGSGVFGRAGRNPLEAGHGAGAADVPGSAGSPSSPSIRPVCPGSPGSPGSPMQKNSLIVSCASIEPVCAGVAQFSFVQSSGELQRLPERGEYVALELPIKEADGTPMVRKWTICDTHLDNSHLFTLIVKLCKDGRGGSRWLHQFSLHVPLRVVDVAGTFTLVDHLPRLRQLRGNVLWLTAGIAITSAYAAVGGYLHNQILAQSAREQLHVLHLHVDRTQSSVAKLDELLQWTKDFSPMNLSARQKHYQLHVFLTQQHQVTGTPAMPAQALPFTLGRRLTAEDIGAATSNYFAGAPFLCYVCGPPSFVDTCTSALLTIGVPEADILTDDP